MIDIITTYLFNNRNLNEYFIICLRKFPLFGFTWSIRVRLRKRSKLASSSNKIHDYICNYWDFQIHPTANAIQISISLKKGVHSIQQRYNSWKEWWDHCCRNSNHKIVTLSFYVFYDVLPRTYRLISCPTPCTIILCLFTFYWYDVLQCFLPHYYHQPQSIPRLR